MTIDVLAADKNPPVITPSSYHGYVNENSAVGTIVSGSKTGHEPLRIAVADADNVKRLITRALRHNYIITGRR